MLAVDGDKVEVEFSGSLGLRVLEDDLEVGGFLISLKSDLVVVVCKLHDLGKVGDGNTEDHVGISSVVVETFHREVEGH